MKGELIREYCTNAFRVRVEALPEDDLDLSWDDDGSIREGLESGKYIAFVAHATVYCNGCEVAEDYLGGCVYESLEDFCQPHGYFQDMVRNVIREARQALWGLSNVKLRH